MNLKAEQLKAVMSKLVGAFKDLESELLAFHMTLISFKKIDPAAGTLFETALAEAKKSRTIQILMTEKYDKALEQAHRRVTDEEMETVVSTFLREWKPTGALN